MPEHRPPTSSRRATIVALLLAFLVTTAGTAGVAVARPAPDPMAAQSWPIADDAPMGAQTAWDQTTGGEVVVAVIDSGTDLGHPDLAPNLWRNPGEVPGNGVDDDGNGVVDDVHGADFVNGDGDPSDDNGHGTHVAGILGARGANGVGAAGIAWQVRIMSVKVLGAAGGGNTALVARGIDYAIASGARILNLSLAGTQRSSDLDAAIARAQAAGALVVVAAGNLHTDLSLLPAWPASSPEPNVLAVAASTAGGVLSAISSFGAAVDLVAPGDAVLATALGGGYEWRTGTSMAAPLVAGTAALVAAASGTTDANVLRTALLAGSRRSVLPIGGGALDAAGALATVVPPAQWRGSDAAATGITEDGTWTTTGDDEARTTRRRARAPRSRARGTLRAYASRTDEVARDRHGTTRVRFRTTTRARASRSARLPRSAPIAAAD